MLAYDFYTSAAAETRRLEDVHVLEVRHFTVVQPSFVIFRQDVSSGTNFKVSALFASLPLAIPPHVGLAAKTPGSAEVVDLLVLVHAL